MKTTLISISLIISLSLNAQEIMNVFKRNSFQLDFGYSQIKEKNLHPKVHGGISYGLKYDHVKIKQNLSHIGLGLRYSRLKTKFEELSATANIQLYIYYEYLFRVINRDKLKFYLGPLAQLNYSLSFYPNWDESHLYWADHLSAGASSNLKYYFNEKRSLEFALSLPVVSVISRPELNRQYKIDDTSVGGILGEMNSHPEAAFWNKNLYVNAQFEYQFNISKRITQAICYTYNYNRVKVKLGLPLQNMQHIVGLKLYF